MKIVRPYTIKGKILCFFLKCLLFPIHVFFGSKWKRAIEFEENPLTYNFRDIFYFAYKYYYKSPVLPSQDNIVDHFKFTLPDDRFETLATISIAGDLMPYEMIKPENTQNLWDEVGSDFFGSDIVFANLETALDISRPNSFVPEVMLSDMHFNTDVTTFEIFNGNGKYKGFNVLSVINNHTMDMGVKGIDATLNFLNQKSIQSIGARLDENDLNYVIQEVNGIKIGFVAYTFSLNKFLPPAGLEWKMNYLPLNVDACDISGIVKDVDDCRLAGAEFIVCSLHFGNAYQIYPSKRSIELVEQIFQACGVDVITGGHPHNLQPWRYYEYTWEKTGKVKKGFAIYSLADFIAYDIYTWCHLCAYLKIDIGRDQNGAIVFNVDVKSLVMRRNKNQLKLYYANKLFASSKLDKELMDIKVLYDACVQIN